MTFAIAAGHKLTTEAAAEVLRAGGTAVDACIAAAFTAGVAEPVLASLLGGGFLLVVPPDGLPACLDAFVQTPKNKNPDADADLREIVVDFGGTTQIFHIGGGTIATPGLVAGLFSAHECFGRLPMPDLVAQACKLARDGVEINTFQAHVLDLVEPIFTAHTSATAIYGSGDGLLRTGEVLKNPELADVMEVLALEGPRFFAEGEVARALLDLGGTHLGPDDLKNYQPQWRDPLEIMRAQSNLLLNPPPSLGGVQIALLLSALPASPDDTTIARAFTETSRLRREAGIDTQPEDAGKLLLNPALLTSLQNILKTHRPATRGTTHISVIDAAGMGAALSLSNGEGCGHVLTGTGLMPNNMLGEEDLVPGGPQSWTSDRRLASMMCPMAVRDGDGSLTMLGSGGSNRIRSALTQVALRLIDARARLDDAIAAPRLHFEHGTGHGIDIEDNNNETRRAAILADWPEANFWPRPSMFFGGVHAVQRSGKAGMEAAGDARRSGVGLTG